MDTHCCGAPIDSVAEGIFEIQGEAVVGVTLLDVND